MFSIDRAVLLYLRWTSIFLQQYDGSDIEWWDDEIDTMGYDTSDSEIGRQ